MTRCPARRVQAAHGRKFAVVSGHGIATQIALETLQAGGNPVDAALAGAAALAVLLPHACTLGGDCFALVHHQGRTIGINGSGASPMHLPADVAAEALARGPLSCSVPGVVGAWQAMHKRFASRPWSLLLAPAIALARDGVPVARDLAGATRANIAALRDDPGCRGLFLANDQPLAEDALLQQPALAESLSVLATGGAESFYRGPLGQHLCRTVAQRGGVLCPADLQDYAPIWTEPLSIGYRGLTVRAMPPNSYGVAMLMQLAALEGVDLGIHPLLSEERLAYLMRAARAAFAQAMSYIVDPALIADRLHQALSPATIEQLRQAVHHTREPPPEVARAQGTAVISVADAGGTGVTLVQSIFAPFGSIIADLDTGIVLNNRLLGFAKQPNHPNAPGPGKRPAHTLNPGMAFAGDRLAFLLGTPGGSGQTITLTQVLTAVVDLGLRLDEAIAAPRWSMDLAGDFALEPELPADMPARLARFGIETRFAREEQRFFFGSAECIALAPDGSLLAVADDRREAAAAAE